MHWQSCLIVKLLHSIVKRSDARWRLSVAKICWSDVFRDETSKIAFDAEIVECIDDFLLCLLLNWKANKLLINDANKTSKMKSKMLLTKLFNVRKTAFDLERSNTLTKLFVDVKLLHSILNDQMHWRFVCFVVCYQIIEQTNCWFNRNIDSLHLIVFLLIWLLNLIKRNVDSYETFK